MAAEFITTSDLALYFGTSGRRALFADSDTDNIARAIAVATALIVSAAKNQFTAASIDAATAATTSADIKSMACKLAAGELTGGGKERPQTIAEDLDDAKRWLGFLAGGSVNVPDWTRISGMSSAAAEVAYVMPDELTFDLDNSSQNWYYRDQEL